MRSRPARLAAVGSVAALGLAAVGCGRADTSTPDQPASADGALVAGDFAALPKPDGAFPLGDPSVGGRTTVQSFKVPGSTPDEIFDYMDGRLQGDGWESAGGLTSVGDGDWQAFWIRQTETLEISLSPDTDDGGTVTTQLDLLLTT
jgi:hypothetical protein